MKRKKEFDKGIFILLIIILVVIVTITTLIVKLKSDKIAEAIQEGNPIKVLFLIADGQKLIAAELFLVNPETEKGALFDIPGDVGSIIQSLKKIDRIDTLFKLEKPLPFKDKVEELLGVEIPYYILMDLSGLEKTVDLLDGLEMFIANPVENLDDANHVLLPSGSLVLDGAKVKTYMTYSLPKAENETEQIGRRMKAMQSLLRRIGERTVYLTGAQVFPYFRDYIQTNIDKSSILTFIQELSKVDTDRMVFQRVLGTHRTVDNHLLLFPHYDGKLVKETTKQTLDSLANKDILGDEDLTVSVKILNGTDKNGLANRTSQVYKSFGFDVLSIGNADSSRVYDKTVVIDMKGDITKAQKVANIISCKNIQTLQGAEKLSFLEDVSSLNEEIDVTIILGKDFDGRYCK